MSTYETYDETSQNYDATRVPVGSEIILGFLALHAGQLDGLSVLDAGCGTGAYSQAILPRVRRVEAVDLSRGMLAKARAKLALEAAAGRMGFHHGPIDDLPFAAASLDAVMINQVTHHLGDTVETGFAGLARVLGEVARVLRPGGVLVFNHCSQDQLRHSYWYYALAPAARERMRRRFVPVEALRALMADAGLSVRGSCVPVDAVCQGPAYFDGRGPLGKAWRDGDSFWALAEPDELAAALAKVRALDDAGELQDFVATHDAARPGLGQITFTCATRD